MEIELDLEESRLTYIEELNRFMNGFIMNYSPYDKNDGGLLSDARERAKASLIIAKGWVDTTESFCCISRLSKRVLFKGNYYFPDYIDNQFEKNALGIYSITDGRFKGGWFPMVRLPEYDDYLYYSDYPTRCCFLNSTSVEHCLSLLSEHEGQELILCYGFNAVYHGKPGFCMRLTTTEYIKESILQTMFFVLNYILSYPLCCFPTPKDKSWVNLSSGNYKATWAVLRPILEQYKPYIISRLEWVKAQMLNHNLRGEKF